MSLNTVYPRVMGQHYWVILNQILFTTSSELCNVSCRYSYTTYGCVGLMKTFQGIITNWMIGKTCCFLNPILFFFYRELYNVSSTFPDVTCKWVRPHETFPSIMVNPISNLNYSNHMYPLKSMDKRSKFIQEYTIAYFQQDLIYSTIPPRINSKFYISPLHIVINKPCWNLLKHDGEPYH